MPELLYTPLKGKPANSYEYYEHFVISAEFVALVITTQNTTTSDNGTELAGYKNIARAFGTKFYFARRPYVHMPLGNVV